jgi:hypothetical protein
MRNLACGIVFGQKGAVMEWLSLYTYGINSKFEWQTIMKVICICFRSVVGAEVGWQPKKTNG